MTATIKLTDANFMVFAAKNYSLVCVDDIDFTEDLSRIRILSKLFSRHKKTGEINERLVINHIVVLYNVFNASACNRMLAFKLRNHLPQLFAFLKYMQRLPPKIDDIGDSEIITKTVIIDSDLYAKLQKL